MKFRRIGAAIMAAAVAVSTLAVSAFAENTAQTEDDLFSLIAAEIPATFKSSIIYVEGVGFLDISGQGFDSSENGNADKDANLDIDFDGIGYVSKANLEAWRETGTLTFGNLKADFDTDGLQWGMFDHSSEYVQLVKMNENNKVTERAVYKITDGEIKKLYDLDTFWTYTRSDGISVGLDYTYVEKHVKCRYTESDLFGGEYTYEDEYDTTFIDELQITVTQLDGTKKTETVAKSVLPEGENIDTSVDKVEYIVRSSWVAYSGDKLATVSYVLKSTDALNEAYMSPDAEHIVCKYYTDGTKKEVYKYSEQELPEDYLSGRYFESIGTEGDIVFWSEGFYGPRVGLAGLYFYDVSTGKLEIVDLSDDQMFIPDIRSLSDKIIAFICDSNSGDFVEYYAIFDDYQDILNYAEKTHYKKITSYKVGDTYIYMFEDLDGKKGYMYGDEKVLAYFDDTNGFAGSYAPVVKDGKAFLIDEDMNAVSEEIEADGVTSVSDEMFIISKGDKYYFVTYDVEAEDPATGAVMVDYSDDASGIKASAKEGVLEDGAKLSVSAVADKTDDNNFTYNISFKKGDKEVQPNGGKVTVKIPVPESIKNKTIYVYRVEADGSYTDMKATVVDGFVVFETDHFSEYLLTGEKKEVEASTPDTGFAGLAMLGVVALAGAAVVVNRKRK